MVNVSTFRSNRVVNLPGYEDVRLHQSRSRDMNVSYLRGDSREYIPLESHSVEEAIFEMSYVLNCDLDLLEDVRVETEEA